MSLFTQAAITKTIELQKAIAENITRKTGDSVAVASGEIRKIPDETFKQATEAALDAIPESVSELTEERQMFAAQQYMVPVIIISLSEAGFFMDEIAHKLGFESESAKATFSEYRKKARELKKSAIAKTFLPIDTEATMPSADPNEPVEINIGQRVFDAVESLLFKRDMVTSFKVPITAVTRGKSVVSQTFSIEDISTIETIEKWETIRNIAAAKYKSSFPTKSGQKTPSGSAKITSTNYVSSVLSDLL